MILNSLILPKTLKKANNRNVLKEEKPVSQLLQPVETNEPVQWKKRSFLALVDNDRETSQLFDLLKGVGKYLNCYREG